MPKENTAVLAFNRGQVSRQAIARMDVRKIPWAAEEQTNWMARVLGSMALRPGLEYIGTTASNGAAKYIPFVFNLTNTAKIEMSVGKMRVWVNDVLVTRPSVSASVTNGAFTSDLSGWTDADETGAASTHNGGGFLQLVGTGFDAAIRRQEVTVTETGTLHALAIDIERGPVILRVGSTAGDDDYIAETELKSGAHSLSFTPSGNFFIQFSSTAQAAKLVDSVAVESSGVMEVKAPWTASDLSMLRWAQSADVIFIASDGRTQYRVERRSNTSWSLVKYEPETGPFIGINTGPTILTPSDINGDITLTASKALFKSTHVGALFRIESVGQLTDATITGQDQFTSDTGLRVTGVGATRQFNIDITGTWSGTVTLQRSIEEPGAWVDVTEWTANVSTTHSDGLDNQIVYYRIGIKTGEYTSGTAVVTLTFSGGSRAGVVRITAFTSSTSVSAAVLSQLGGVVGSSNWYEGVWSDKRGFPSAVLLAEGRLWWFGKDRIIGSVSDAFENFDPDVEGDSGPINRTIGEGPVDVINWALGLQRIIAGAELSEKSIRSTAFDEPITPSNFNFKDASTQGSASVLAVKIDKRGIFVQRSGSAVFELIFALDSNDYDVLDLTELNPEIGKPSVVTMAVQRQPDTRLHCVRSDGKVAVLLREPIEELLAWIPIETDGEVEDVVILPQTEEDAVYYVVKRTVNAATVRYIEKWALESECIGGTVNKQADSFVVFTNSPASTTVSGLDHLEGKDVIVWQDGVCPVDGNNDPKTFTVTGGSITLDTAATTGVVGLAYEARYKSTKMAYASGLGTALNQRKTINYLGFFLEHTHHYGIKFGRNFTDMDNLPLMIDGAEVDADTVHTEYDFDATKFPGEWDTDTRVHLKANAPRPARVLALTASVETHDRG